MKNNNFKRQFLLVFGVAAAFLAIFGYLKTVPETTSDQNDPNEAKIVVEPKTFDFDEVEFGQVVEHVFEVRNEGGGALEIKRVSTSCGCTKAKVDKERLEPGEKAELLVTYDSGAMGKQIIGKKVERFVYLRSNDPGNPQEEVTIYARVK